MRVLHVTRDYPPRHCGGISTAVQGLVRALRHAGIGGGIVSFDDYRPPDRRDPPLRNDERPDSRQPGPGGPAGAARANAGMDDTAADADLLREAPGELLRIDDERDLQALAAFAAALAPDVIQLHVDLLWPVAAELRRRLRVPLVATLHVCHRRMLRVLAADRASASQAAQERALAQADVVVAPTRSAAAVIVEDYPEVRGRLHVAGFTVDPAEPATLARPRLACVGRFGAVKGTDRLIALLPHLLQEPRLALDVVGGLPRNPRRDRRWRRRIAEAAGEHRRRVVLHGWLAPSQRDEVLAGARALLSVSRVETFGLAALEALARAVPVCGYREPALVETAPHQLWLDEAPPEHVAATVVELLRDRARCREAGAAGRAALRPWTAVADDWRRVYAAATAPAG